jgi:hypothetical protein
MPRPPHSYVHPNFDAIVEMDGMPQSSPVLSMFIYASKCTARYGCSLPSFIQTDKGACRVNSDMSVLQAADGVFFHWQRTESFPHSVHRRPGAFWVLSSDESSTYSFNRHDELLEQMKNDVNVLMSYERYSDIYIPFDYLVPRQFPLDTVDVGTKHKKKLIVAIISNCNAHYRKTRLEVCSVVTLVTDRPRAMYVHGALVIDDFDQQCLISTDVRVTTTAEQYIASTDVVNLLKVPIAQFLACIVDPYAH